MKQSDSYDRSIHRTGRLGSILAIAWMLGIPAVMCTVYHMFPSIPDLLLFGQRPAGPVCPHRHLRGHHLRPHAGSRLLHHLHHRRSPT